MARSSSCFGIKVRFFVIFVSNAYGISNDCSSLVIFSQGLGMKNKQPGIWTSLQVDCCTAGGVICVSQRVTQIGWYSLGLNGSINGTALPNGLTYLDLHGNQLTGTIPTLPNGLTHLDFGNNQLTGGIQLLPSGLTYLEISRNQLTGGISLFPNGLTFISCYENKLTGSIPTLPSGLTHLDFGSNQLSGNIPFLPNGLTLLYLYANFLIGNLPLLPSGLTFIMCWGNQLTGSISILPDSLTQIDISSNRLNGNIPLLPSGLTKLIFWGNQFTGNLSYTWPSGLTVLVAYTNQLTGSLPEILPTGLNELRLNGNQLTGNLPNFPLSLQYLYLGSPGNQFTGTLRLNQPKKLSINNNRITDVVITDSSQLVECDLSYNPLLGNPNIANLSVCSVLGLYSLPNTMITFNAKSTQYSLSNTAMKSYTKTTQALERIISITWSTETELCNQTTPIILFYFTALVFEWTLLNWILICLRMLISIGVFALVIIKTPWTREWKNKRKLRNKVSGLQVFEIN